MQCNGLPGAGFLIHLVGNSQDRWHPGGLHVSCYVGCMMDGFEIIANALLYPGSCLMGGSARELPALTLIRPRLDSFQAICSHCFRARDRHA